MINNEKCYDESGLLQVLVNSHCFFFFFLTQNAQCLESLIKVIFRFNHIFSPYCWIISMYC